MIGKHVKTYTEREGEEKKEGEKRGEESRGEERKSVKIRQKFECYSYGQRIPRTVDVHRS